MKDKKSKIQREYDKYKKTIRKEGLEAISFNEYKSIWNAYSEARKKGKLPGHRSISGRIVEKQKYGTAASVARKRQRILRDQFDVHVELEQLKVMDNETWISLMDSLLSEKGMTMAEYYQQQTQSGETDETISQYIFGSK